MQSLVTQSIDCWNKYRQTDNKMTDKKIIFYDSKCFLCDGFVSFVYKRDQKKVFHFSSLHGNTAGKTLPSQFIQNQDTVVYYENSHLFTHSDAALKILSHLSVPWKILSKITRIVPRSLRDLVYRWIARNRHKLNKNACLLHFKEENSRFLD